MLPFAYLKMRKTRHLCVITSRHFHGALIGRVCELFGFTTLRGSTNHGGKNRGGSMALRLAIKNLRLGSDVALTPDGPKGPAFSVADGAVVMAAKTRVPVVSMRVKISKAWRLKTWDNFQIPKPFARVDYEISAPFSLDCENLQDLEQVLRAKEKIRKNLTPLC